MYRLKNYIEQNSTNILVGATVLISLTAWYVCYLLDLVLVYNDAMSHMNIPRLVIDNLQPGFAQLGTVWLPLSHVLALPFIWNEWAWQSGFAGSLVSMVSYVVAVLAVYKTIIELTSRRAAALIGAAAVALNINFLYLQSTPLTESLFVALFAGSVYFLVRYLKTSQVHYLLPLSLLVSLQVMTRYDGWFAAACIAVVLLVHELMVRRATLSHALGYVAIYAVPVGFTCLLWFGWNAAIYGDPIYFATSEYSAKAQQEVIDESLGLATKGDLGISLDTFNVAAGFNVGWLIFVPALIGWLLYIVLSKYRNAGFRFMVFVVLSSVIVFNVLSLFLGFSTIAVPNPGDGLAGHLFNVRYGIVALPAVAIGIGLLVSSLHYRHIAAAVVLVAIVTQSVVTLSEKPITLQDGLAGASSYHLEDIAEQLRDSVESDDKVLMSMYWYGPAAFDSSMNMRQFIHEGAMNQWQEARANPEKSAGWIVMSRHGDNEPVRDALVVRGENAFLEHYTLVYESDNGQIYRHKDRVAQRSVE